MGIFWQVVSSILLVFLILLFARFVVDWVMVLARSWRPSGFVAAGLEVVYATTDPPLKAIRKVIPPLNLGSIRLDLAFMVLLIAVYILRSITSGLALTA
ncbi:MULTISPECIES: YggT family protein [Geodermatophilus]|uniref:YggT family protein n=2 Tax=Geodermatophilus TaxID=1860 RepID=A0A1I7ASJ4_9ACTN|nr:YggT family protein [Geodermatophilus amargosae]NEM06507.1 YggT family protein [Geodermatophilus normandii]SFT77856.1 YggT family protein [Geodermatophilus amargosae]